MDFEVFKVEWACLIICKRCGISFSLLFLLFAVPWYAILNYEMMHTLTPGSWLCIRILQCCDSILDFAIDYCGFIPMQNTLDMMWNGKTLVDTCFRKLMLKFFFPWTRLVILFNHVQYTPVQGSGLQKTSLEDYMEESGNGEAVSRTIRKYQAGSATIKKGSVEALPIKVNFGNLLFDHLCRSLFLGYIWPASLRV